MSNLNLHYIINSQQKQLIAEKMQKTSAPLRQSISMLNFSVGTVYLRGVSSFTHLFRGLRQSCIDKLDKICLRYTAANLDASKG